MCTNKGTWFKKEPKCVKYCPALKKEHLNFECFYRMEPVSCDSFMRPGTVAKFKCDEFTRPSYDHMSYSDRTTCSYGGIWGETLPSCSLACGRVNQVNNVDPTLVFAKKTKYGEYPWHVAIYIKDSNRYEYNCGGSLIAENFILTAAHCVFTSGWSSVKLNVADLKVAVGKGKRDYYIKDEYQVNSDVVNIIVPETYAGVGTRYADDIALLQTDVHFHFNYFVLPVCMDRFGIIKFRKDAEGTIAGWGETEDGKLSDELRVIRLPIIPIAQCRQRFPNFVQFLTSDKFCALHQNGSGTGRGDSGGGITFEYEGQHYIVGVVSIKQANSNLYTGFTSIYRFTEWIYKTIKGPRRPTITDEISVCENWNRNRICKNNVPVLPANGKVDIAKPRLHKYMVLISSDNEEYPRNSMCVGALISDRWVLTSADCFRMPHENQSLYEWVKLGDLDYYSTSDDARPQVKRIIKTIIHPRYDPSQVPHSGPFNKSHNLALVKLDSPVVFDEYVAPACLHTSKQIAVDKVVLTGLAGLTYEKSESLTFLVAESNLVNTPESIQPKLQVYSLADRLTCVEDRPCWCSFIGAPLTYTRDGGCIWTLVGIAANGLVSQMQSVPKWLARTTSSVQYARVADHLAWINSIVWPDT
ncbi:hypothetical protein O3M35_006843 [Rhynocoris fuscipes]